MSLALPSDEFPPPSPERGASSSSGPSGSSSGDDETRVPWKGSSAAGGEEPLALGPSIPGYVLSEEVHRGGQGVVYRGTQAGTKRQVALKVLLEGPFASEAARKRFEREVELAASLRHPNIVTILESGMAAGRSYFAMEYIDGLRLDRYVAQRRPPRADVLQLFETVCLAVNFAHQRGVIHRDLKPPNILVDEGGEPHVLDFGLAKPLPRAGSAESTVPVLSLAGQLIGTVAYMSPEQAAGSADVDVRSDVYSLGVIFYEALVGRPPYEVEGPLGEVLRRIAQDEPVHPAAQAARGGARVRIDDELATILLKCLEKEPQRRYQSAGDLARDLHHLRIGEPIEAKRASGLYVLKKMIARYRLQAATAGLTLLMLIGSLITFAALFAQQRELRQRADEKTAEARQAVRQEQAARNDAQEQAARAQHAQDRLRRALVRQHIQRGDLALERGDLTEARDSYWDALEVGPGPSAHWALRRYHLQTANAGAAILALEPHGPMVLSPTGQAAAVCDGPSSIWVRSVETGSVLSTVRTPGEVTHAHVTDEGALAAAGLGWARAWPPGAMRPSVSVQLLPDARPQALYAAENGEALLLVGVRVARLTRGAVGQADLFFPLQERVTGSCDFDPQAGRLALTTDAGIELIAVREGRLVEEAVLTPPEPCRALRLSGDTLTVLGSAVHVTPLTGPGARREWTRLMGAVRWPAVEAAGEGEAASAAFLEVEQTPRGTILALPDGQVRSIDPDEPTSAWPFATERLSAARLVARGRLLVTLDDRGTLTRWMSPERIEQQRPVLQQVPTTWASSADGATVLLGLPRGRVVAYQPEVSRVPRTILRPRLLAGLPGAEDEADVALALSGDGRRAVIRDGTTLRFYDLGQRQAWAEVWDDRDLPEVGAVALSGDGTVAALLAHSVLGDWQRIVLRGWTGAAERDPQREPPAIDFVGAEVRDLVFVPHSHRLAVGRSNGQLFLLDVDRSVDPADEAAGAARTAPEPWLTLDAPITKLAVGRTGEYLAAACEDGVVRLIAVGRGEVRHRIEGVQNVSALAFNPRDEVLLVRTVDGHVRLFDPASAEGIANWAVPSASPRPLAAWLGEADALLVERGGSVYEQRYDHADALIERSRPYAVQRQIARHVAGGDFAAAWAAAAELAAYDAELGLWTRVDVLSVALRRPGRDVPEHWTATVLHGATPTVWLQLGHAAYDGERFAQAREWLRAGFELVGGEVDALTLQHIAECDYLFGAYGAAADEFAELLKRADLDPAGVPTIALQRVAALVLAGRAAEGRQAALRVNDPDAWGRYGDLVAGASARIIARVLAGLEDETVMSMALSNLLTGLDPERRLLYWDDARFFAGELARQRGDLAEAALQYQRCVELSRDPWPANWSRYRLAELAATSAPAAPEPGATVGRSGEEAPGATRDTP